MGALIYTGASPAAWQPAAQAATAAPTVLVVDDEPVILDLLTEILVEEGYTVLTATDGLTALALARQACPALVLSDVMLPGMDGLAFCTQLRADPQTAQVPILLMSAGRSGCDAAPCTAFLRKPFAVPDLLAMIDHALGRA